MLNNLQGPRSSGFNGFIWTHGFLETLEFSLPSFTVERVQGSELLTCLKFRNFEPINWNPLRGPWSGKLKFRNGHNKWKICWEKLEIQQLILSVIWLYLLISYVPFWTYLYTDQEFNPYMCFSHFIQHSNNPNILTNWKMIMI